MLGVLLSTQAWQPARFAVGRLARRLTMSAGVVTETVEIDGQTMEVERFVEADVGMEFPKVELTEKIFDDPTGSKKDTGKTWPDEFIFPPQAFKRMDENDDEDFYGQPRLCYHIDEGAVRALTNYYKENIPVGSAILDICSSWVSHYPADFPQKMSRIAATGMVQGELARNPQLTDFEPKNLNVDPTLPYDDNTFDAATCVVSVDYLIKPLEVFKEINRVLKPGGKFILSQSNRCFQTKAVMMWLQQSDLQHCQVIGSYFHYAGGFAPARAFDVSPKGPRTNDPLFIVESTKL